jgi:hypothetical protein
VRPAGPTRGGYACGSGGTACRGWYSSARTSGRGPTDRSIWLAGRTRTRFGHQNQRPVTVMIDGGLVHLRCLSENPTGNHAGTLGSGPPCGPRSSLTALTFHTLGPGQPGQPRRMGGWATRAGND